ncbi:MAG: HAMP domain-containing histidine kinase [Leptospiraceae bacterium]|nr:HAMP domain-containing histidine kinase [Leptospiraceae bacterium]
MVIEAESEFRRLVASGAHEIRNLINGTLGLIELASIEEDPDTKDRYLHMAKRSGEHVSELLNSVLDFSLLDTSTSEAIKPVELAPFLEVISAPYERLARQKQMQYSLTISDSLPPRFLLHELKLRQVLENLLSNALKYSSAGRVTLAVDRRRGAPAEKKQSALWFSVEDTGRGIPAQFHESIFENMFRLEGAAKGAPGFGLGLAISRNLVESMGGEIAVQSEPGKGSLFHFWVPATEERGESGVAADRLSPGIDP